MKRNRGFTLLELLIVITVVAILAAIAVTSYQEQVRKSKRSEAMKNLAEYQLLMEKWRASCPSYADTTPACKDRTGDGDANDPQDATYPTMPAIASNNYTYSIAPDSVTPDRKYVVTATKKASFADPKCGDFFVTVDSGVATRDVTSGDKNYCWP